MPSPEDSGNCPLSMAKWRTLTRTQEQKRSPSLDWFQPSNQTYSNSFRQNQQWCDHSQRLNASASEWPRLCTFDSTLASPPFIMEYKTFLFTYHFDGANWEIPIHAKTREEAQARIKRMVYAQYTGELVASIHVPSMSGWFTRFFRGCRRVFSSVIQ